MGPQKPIARFGFFSFKDILVHYIVCTFCIFFAGDFDLNVARNMVQNHDLRIKGIKRFADFEEFNLHYFEQNTVCGHFKHFSPVWSS